MKRLVLQLDRSIPVMKTLASAKRVQILELLSNEERTISELAQLLNISQPAVTVHIQKLEEIGLVKSELTQRNGNVYKQCARLYDEIVLHLPTPQFQRGDHFYEVDMPIGLFSDFEVGGTCGIVSETDIVGHIDDPNSFLVPQRVFSQLLWFGKGFIEYSFPNNLPDRCRPTRLELSMEICSEAYHHNEDYPSDITFWINDHELGTWTSPGDFGDRRGKFTPNWWHWDYTQYGLLKRIVVDEESSRIDGDVLSSTRIGDLEIRPNTIDSNNPLSLRIGFKPESPNQGGLNLFGERFGDHAQNLRMRLYYAEEAGADSE